MTREQDVLLQLLSFEFMNKKPTDSFVGIDWKEIYKEARLHKVVPFLYDASNRLKEEINSSISVDESVISEMKRYTIGGLIRDAYKINEQKNIFDKWEENGIEACVLKGTSLKVNYPKPELRLLGDIDLYVMPEKIVDAGNILKSMGYVNDKTATQYHTSFVKNGIEIEVHNSLPGLPSGKTKKELLFLKNLCGRGYRGDEKYANVCVPSVCDNGIIQILHIFHHTVFQTMKLRLLCDWMFFVDKSLHDEEWNKDIGKIYKRAGLDHAAKIFTKISKLYLGLDNSEITWCDEISEEECKLFIEFVMFGQQKESMKKTVEGCENELREDVWEYRNQGHFMLVSYVFFRNLKLVFEGKRTVVECVRMAFEKNADKNLLIKLNLLKKKYALDYSI